MNGSLKTFALRTIAFAVGLSLLAPGQPAAAMPEETRVKVVARARLANNTEAATIVTSGRYKDSVVVVDGNDLLRFNVRDNVSDPAHKILDLRTLPIDFALRGIAHVPAEEAFLAQEPSQLRTLIVFDEQGRALPSRPITYPAGFAPVHFEGLAYIPPEASRHGDRLVSVVYDGTFAPQIHVMTRDGVVEAVIAPEALAHEFVTGIGYRAPDRLMLGTEGNGLIWTVDLDGNVIGAPVQGGPGMDFEGLGQASDGRIYGTPYSGGRLLAFDSELGRLPGEDRSYTVGIGQPFPCCLAWNGDLDAFVVYQAVAEEIDVVPATLDSAATLIGGSKFGSAQGITYLPDEKLIGVTRRGQRRILLFDNGGAAAGSVGVPSVPCSAAATSPTCATSGRMLFASYLPSIAQFSFALRGRPDPNTFSQIHFADRGGAYVRTLDVRSLGIEATHFAVPYWGPDGSGALQLMVSDDIGLRLVVTDLAGTTVTASIDYRRQLNVLSVNGAAQITSGPLKGAIAVTDTEHSEIVIFRIK